MLSPTQIFSQILACRLEFILTLAHLFFAFIELLHVFANFSPVLAYFTATGAVADILSQFGAVFFQFGAIFLQLLPIFPQFFSCLADILNALVNFPLVGAAIAATSVTIVVARVVFPRVDAGAVVMVVGSFLVAPDSVAAHQPRPTGELTAENPAVAGCRLMARGSPRIPDATFARRRQMPRRHTKLAMIIVSGCGGGKVQSRGKKSRCEGTFDVGHDLLSLLLKGCF